MTPATLEAYRSLGGRRAADRARGRRALVGPAPRAGAGHRLPRPSVRRAPVPGFHPTTVKIMTDGVLENHTGALLEPYCDGCGGQTDNHGLSYVDRELLAAAVTAARPPRLPGAPARHRGPGRAQRARRRRGGPRRERSRRPPAPHRPHPGVQPEDVPRFAGSAWSPTPRRTGPRSSRRWRSTPSRSSAATGPTGSTRSATCCGPGRRCAMGSDWSVTTADPLRQIEVAVTRVDPGNRDRRAVPARAGAAAAGRAGAPSRPARRTSTTTRTAARCGWAPAPTSPCSTATCSRPAPARWPTPACELTVAAGRVVFERDG